MALSGQKLASAIKYNNESAQSVGWMAFYEPVLAALGFNLMSPDGEQFAQAVAAWQAKQKPKLSDDGKLGPNTWRTMKSTLGIGPKPGSIKEPLYLAGSGPMWLRVAQAEKNRWDTEMSGWSSKKKKVAEVNMSRDEEYFYASPYFGGKVKDPGVIPKNESRLDWCAAFANWCLHRAGFSHTGSAGANSFVQKSLWNFDSLEAPRQGCVVVVGNGSKGAHVAFLWDSKGLPTAPNGNVTISKGRELKLLGGNQSQRITIKSEKRRMLAARGQNGILSPYLWPKRGASNCNHIAPMEQGHYCGKIH